MQDFNIIVNLFCLLKTKEQENDRNNNNLKANFVVVGNK